jgi:hypothetical protein
VEAVLEPPNHFLQEEAAMDAAVLPNIRVAEPGEFTVQAPVVPVLRMVEVPVEAEAEQLGHVRREARPGWNAQQVEGVEQQIRERPLDAIQEKVVEATQKILADHGPQNCIGVAVEVQAPNVGWTTIMPGQAVTLWNNNGTTNAGCFASGGYAYIEAVNQMVTGDNVETTVRVRYSTNTCGVTTIGTGGSATGWIDLYDTNYLPKTWAKSDACTKSVYYANKIAMDSNTTAISGWKVRGSTATMKVLYGWMDGECRAAYQGYANGGEWGEAVVYPLRTPAERLREILETRTAPAFISPRIPVPETQDVREQRARETLRRVLGELKFRDFLRKGFVSVRAKSGLIYQIFPGHGITAVFDKAVMVERLCVVLKGDFPPTDSIIMRYLLILNNEEQFRGLAVKHNTTVSGPMRHYPSYNPFDRGFGTSRLPKNPDQRTLVEIFREMKGVKAPAKIVAASTEEVERLAVA